jgi:hypothetical protein
MVDGGTKMYMLVAEWDEGQELIEELKMSLNEAIEVLETHRSGDDEHEYALYEVREDNDWYYVEV